MPPSSKETGCIRWNISTTTFYRQSSYVLHSHRAVFRFSCSKDNFTDSQTNGLCAARRFFSYVYDTKTLHFFYDVILKFLCKLVTFACIVLMFWLILLVFVHLADNETNLWFIVLQQDHVLEFVIKNEKYWMNLWTDLQQLIRSRFHLHLCFFFSTGFAYLLKPLQENLNHW